MSRQNLSDWILKGAKLLKPLEATLKSQLLTEELLHADETVLEVLKEPGRAADTKSYLWLYRTSQNRKHAVILYDYQTGRSGDYAKAHLKDWQETCLHCDSFSGYKKLTNAKLCGCLVHAKRKFHEAWKINTENGDARKGEAFLQKLFAIGESGRRIGI